MKSETKIKLAIGLSVFFSSWLVYLRTMAPTIVFWDAPEFISVSYILGIPHPPGYPVPALIGRVATIVLPFFKEVALRVNMIPALFAACSTALVYLLTVKLIGHWRGQPKDRMDEVVMHLAGLGAALTLAFRSSWWDNAIDAKGLVYGTAILMMCLTIWIVLRWQERIGQEGNR